MGASESIYSSLPKDIIQNIASPVILMKAQKNDIEREGMRKAHITDGVAMCETLSYLEQKVKEKRIFCNENRPLVNVL